MILMQSLIQRAYYLQEETLKFHIQTHYAQEPLKQYTKHTDKGRHLKAQGRMGYQGEKNNF